MTTLIYKNYTQEALDRAYDQREWAPNAGQIIERWRQAASRRESLGCQEIAYGPSERQKLDIYPAPDQTLAPVHFHVHGGAWTRQSKDDCVFAIPAQQQAGLLTVVPDFDLLPTVSMPEMVAQLTRSFVNAVESVSAHGGDSTRIIVSGHSSGAHLAALLAATDMSEYGLPVDIIKSLLIISGPYDLEPVLLSSRREYVQLDSKQAIAMNAYQQANKIRCPVTMRFGENESPEFVRQSQSMADHLRQLGKQASCTMIPGANHFEMMDQLGQTGSPVFEALLSAVPKSKS